MTHIELDDQILNHPKFVRANDIGGSDTLFLWLGLRAYCGQFLSDGFVPDYMISDVRGPRDPKRRLAALSALKTVVLVEDAPGGVVLHDYLDWAQSREQVLIWRANNKTRGALRSNPALMKAVRVRDADLCRYCGKPVDWKDHRGRTGGTYDHVIPLIQGGTNDIDNVVACCRECNSRKGGNTPNQVGMLLLPPKHTGSELVSVRKATGITTSNYSVSREEGEGEVLDPDLPEESPERNQPTPVDAFERSFTGVSPGANELFEAWQAESGKTGVKLTDRGIREIFEQLVSQKLTTQDVIEVVRGAKLDKWARESARLMPSPLLKSAEQRAKFKDMYRNPPAPAVNEFPGRNRTAANPNPTPEFSIDPAERERRRAEVRKLKEQGTNAATR